MNYKNTTTVLICSLLAGFAMGCEYYNESRILPVTQPSVTEGSVKTEASEDVTIPAAEQEQETEAPAETPQPPTNEPVVDAGDQGEEGVKPSRVNTFDLSALGKDDVKPSRVNPIDLSSLGTDDSGELTVQSVMFNPYEEKITVTFSREIDFEALQNRKSVRLLKYMKIPFCDDAIPWGLPCEETIIDKTGKIWQVDAKTIRINAGKMKNNKDTVLLSLTGADKEDGLAIRDTEGHEMEESRRYIVKVSCGYPVGDIASGEAFNFDSQDNYQCTGSVEPLD